MLFRNFATVGGATLLSRLLGFLRDVMLAAFVGAGPVADAFVVAFRLPNLFRRLFAEGAFNSAFVPLFARSLEEKGEEGARQFAGEIAAALFWTLVVVTALAEIAMPLLVYVLAPGYFSDPAKYDLTVLMARVAFPYLLFMSLLAFISGILNTFQRFAAAAMAPVMLNVVMGLVLAGIGLAGLEPDATTGVILVAGVAVAGVVQLAFVAVDLKRLGFKIPLFRPRWTPGVKRLLALGLPGVLAGGITQINITVGTIIASMQESANSFLYYADRVYQLPLGVVGIAIGVVLLPSLTRSLRSGQDEEVLRIQNRSMEFALALTLPAAVALVLIPREVISVLFERGAFGPEAVDQTAWALMAFAVGLPAFVLNKVLSPGYFSREDTKTPMYFAGVAMVINVGLALALFPFMAHVGIAVATSVAGWVNTALLGLLLYKRGHFKLDAAAVRRVPLLLLASVLMGGVVLGLSTYVPGATSPQFLVRAGHLALLVTAGMISFGVFAQVTGAVNFLGYAKRFAGRKTSGTS
ncbi:MULTISPECIES: murein biosynthesis integral membrane protein MurJ [Pseudovibrio]|uniref:murein biosynthesis integral membrane protein MurJ n=1 Tax=Stappiaceae TaxID=2821832 RepID=UPI002364FF59|nr:MULTISPECIES: murein biosynthesis integral membrane protein MurJ [Pseudovibrio]MDD7909557.1 murein biosynthesis integral membrane protein MurJ [Pseudovibrio exalbescens]MDX5595090.1 murein biosynthesis integral membrane protein MurJ [Pseudovibrio sp. SPO723]